MFEKPKRKEKRKRGIYQNRNKLLILGLLLLLGLLGLLLGVLLPMQRASTAQIDSAGSTDCYFTVGYGSQPNPAMSETFETVLREGGINLKSAAVVDDLREYYVCGTVSEPLYQTCARLELILPVSDPDPSRRMLGDQIAAVLDVLQSSDQLCTPEEMQYVFDTPNGRIFWQMATLYALEAFNSGMRGDDLYNLYTQ